MTVSDSGPGTAGEVATSVVKVDLEGSNSSDPIGIIQSDEGRELSSIADAKHAAIDVSHVVDDNQEPADDEERRFDFAEFVQSLDHESGDLDQTLDSILEKTVDVDHLITLASLYKSTCGRVRVIDRVLGQTPNGAVLDRLHGIATRAVCLDSMLALAQANHIASQHALALMYSEMQRPDEFESWLTRAADSGHVLSMMGMVSLLSQRNPSRSFEYARKAADSGLRTAQYIAGRCLILGHGVTSDFAAGLEYMTAAAEAGMAEAQVLAGGIFSQEHHGMAPDPERALRYFKAAADQNNSEALYILGSLLMSGSGGAEMDRDQAVRLIRRAAELDNPRAQLDLGKMYNAGEYLAEDFEQGFAWCLRAAFHRLPMAAFIVGIMHLEGMGCERNILAGCHWIECAALQNHSEARKLLGSLLSDTSVSEGFQDWKMTQSLLKIMTPSLRLNLVTLV